MKAVAILRTSRTEGPGYFATYLERRSIKWKLVALDQGKPVPRDARRFAGLVLMGGPMSANDGLAWVDPVLELIRDAARKDVPVLGHCLGAQLMSRALGGTVRVNDRREIGWGPVAVADNGVAREWLGELQSFETFQWHGDTFSIPPGATRVLGNPHCANQGFALGKHFGMQCHVEMTAELVQTWLDSGAEEMAEHRASPAVQPREEIEKDLGPRLERLHQVADRIYDRWIEGLSRGN